MTEVDDGDTFEARGPDGDHERVRIIGINAPESDECFGSEATRALNDLIHGEEVELIADSSDRDRYGRLLRYVESDDMDIGLSMVASGHALARRYPPDTARADPYAGAQSSARTEGSGLWAGDACGDPDDAAAELLFDAIQFDPEGPDLDDLNEEWVRIANRGDTAVHLGGWVVRDESASNRFRFTDALPLEAGESITLRTGCGNDDEQNLHWCRSGAAVWNNDGDTAFLLDPDGNIVASREGP